MSFKPFKIFVIDSANDIKPSYYQDTAFAALLQSTLTNKAEIFCVKLVSALDWMPAGHIHVQGFGSVHIMYNFEGELTEELIGTMNQIYNKADEILKNNLRLVLHKAFISDGNDNELNEVYLLLQNAVGRMKYTDIQSELAQTLAEHNENAQEFIERSNALAGKIVNAYKEHLDKVIATSTSSELNFDEVKSELSLLGAEYDLRRGELEKECEADKIATLAKQTPLRIKAEVLGFFANRIANGYHVSQETVVEAHATESQTPIFSSSM